MLHYLLIVYNARRNKIAHIIHPELILKIKNIGLPVSLITSVEHLCHRPDMIRDRYKPIRYVLCSNLVLKVFFLDAIPIVLIKEFNSSVNSIFNLFIGYVYCD